MDVFVSFIILAAIVAVSYLLLLGILTGISVYHNLGVFVDAFGQ